MFKYYKIAFPVSVGLHTKYILDVHTASKNTTSDMSDSCLIGDMTII